MNCSKHGLAGKKLSSSKAMLSAILKGILQAFLSGGLQYLQERRQEAALKGLGYAKALQENRAKEDAARKAIDALPRASGDAVNQRLRDGKF